MPRRGPRRDEGVRRRRSRRLTAAAVGLLPVTAAVLVLVHDRDGPRAPFALRLGPDRVVYSAGQDLWIVAPGGRGRTQITATTGWVEFDPALSPDGRYVAYRRERRATGPSSGTSAIFVMSLVDGSQWKVSPAEGGESPAWSPDGRRIAFSNRAGLAIVAAEGGKVRPLNVVGSCPIWSPEGDRIAYCGAAPSGGSSLEIVNADGTGNRVLISDSHDNFVGAWAPDGNRLAFTSDRRGDLDAWTIDVDGARLRLVAGGPGSQAVNVWLPDGRLVVADSPPGADTTRWITVRPDGTGRKRLAFLDGASDPLDWRTAAPRS